jgi:hypothetical protein
MKRMTMLMALLGLATILSSCIAAKTVAPYQPVPTIVGKWNISTTFAGDTSPSTLQVNLVPLPACNGVGNYVPLGGADSSVGGTNNPISCSVASNGLGQGSVTAVSGNFAFPPQNFVVVTSVVGAGGDSTLQWFFLVECADAGCNTSNFNQYVGWAKSSTPVNNYSGNFRCDNSPLDGPDDNQMPCSAYITNGDPGFPFTATSN